MAEFSEGFSQYLVPTEDERARILNDGIIVLDTNVLLDLYRYTASARAELFAVLERLRDRIWVPHQVALEFHRNRLKVIGSFSDSYVELRDFISSFVAAHGDTFRQKVGQFANRISLASDDRDRLLAVFTRALDELDGAIQQLQDDHGISVDFTKDDPVLRRLQELLLDKVGPPLEGVAEKEARDEAKRRTANSEPPGFKDADKDDSCGDYLLWHQSLIEAGKNHRDFTLVTRDNKEDWFVKVKGRTIYTRPELITEAKNVAQVSFQALSVSSFLRYVDKHLSSPVSVETRRQAVEIEKNAVIDQNMVRLPSAYGSAVTLPPVLETHDVVEWPLKVAKSALNILEENRRALRAESNQMRALAEDHEALNEDSAEADSRAADLDERERDLAALARMLRIRIRTSDGKSVSLSERLTNIVLDRSMKNWGVG
jgi:hypothetical protein